MTHRVALVILALALSACGALPDFPAGAGEVSTGAWPRLEPLETLLIEEAPLEASEEAANALSARADALRARAALLRAPVPDADAFESLRTRLAG